MKGQIETILKRVLRQHIVFTARVEVLHHLYGCASCVQAKCIRSLSPAFDNPASILGVTALVGTLFAYVLLGEALGVWGWVGAGLVGAAMLLSELRPGSKKGLEAAPPTPH